MTPFDQFAKDYQGKKVLIFGLGLQGRGLGDTQIFAEIGAHVTVTDTKTESQLAQSIAHLSEFPISYHLGGHTEADILENDVIVRNPSVPWNHPLLELARSRRIPVVMDEALFFRYTGTRQTIGVTGTRGKSTTTTLISLLLKQANIPQVLAGNISPIASLQLLKEYDPANWYVFELSSWQLQSFHDFRISPHLAVVTNIYHDHLLDRSFAEYRQDKTAIFLYQKTNDRVFLNQQNVHTEQMAELVSSNLHWFTQEIIPEGWRIQLRGQHNRENIQAAVAVARSIGISETYIQEVVESFSGLAFRQQMVGVIHDVSIVNDTTSTTPIATVKALDTYPNSILICGGTTKKLPVGDMVRQINRRAKQVVLLSGTGTEEIKGRLEKSKVIAECGDLNSAFRIAMQCSQPGDTVLFSPGFTSFGLFLNEFDRGRQFNQIIESYKQETSHS